jgi:hypothetical protein
VSAGVFAYDLRLYILKYGVYHSGGIAVLKSPRYFLRCLRFLNPIDCCASSAVKFVLLTTSSDFYPNHKRKSTCKNWKVTGRFISPSSISERMRC